MNKYPDSNAPKPPGHLRAATKRWWAEVVRDYALECHHLKLLTLAGEAWDRCHAARLIVERHGLTFEDRFGQPRLRPEADIERHSRAAFASLLRELGLDRAPAAESRPPAIAPNAHLKAMR